MKKFKKKSYKNKSDSLKKWIYVESDLIQNHKRKINITLKKLYDERIWDKHKKAWVLKNKPVKKVKKQVYDITVNFRTATDENYFMVFNMRDYEVDEDKIREIIESRYGTDDLEFCTEKTKMGRSRKWVLHQFKGKKQTLIEDGKF